MSSMKLLALAIPCSVTSVIVAAHAGVVITSNPLNLNIPDNASTGLATTLTVPGSQVVSSVMVSLNLSVPGGNTGWVGDLYCYVQHGSEIAVLLNRVGRTADNPDGYADGQSVAVTFADGAANGDIHGYRTVVSGNESTPLSGTLTGLWQPDGRTADPATVLDSSPRVSSPLSGFSGQSTDGTWTLFLADASSGGQYRLDSWSLSVQFVPVPEPGTATAVALALAAWALWPRRRLMAASRAQ
jgi:subtilisin-like proprotein convertase family protein